MFSGRKLRNLNMIKYTNSLVNFYIGVLFFIIFTPLLFILALSGFNNASIFGFRSMLVMTSSMEPVMLANSIALIEEVTMQDVVLGDIVVFRSLDGHIVTHRVVAMGAGGFITKGDDNLVKDSGLVTERMLLARVVHIWNGVVPFVTLFFGRFSDIVNIPSNEVASELLMFRLLLGWVKIAILSICLFRVITWAYDVLVINYFLRVKPAKVCSSEFSWDDTKVDYINLCLLLEQTKKGGVFKQLLVYHYVALVYQSLCLESAVSYRTHKLYKTALKILGIRSGV